MFTGYQGRKQWTYKPFFFTGQCVLCKYLLWISDTGLLFLEEQYMLPLFYQTSRCYYTKDCLLVHQGASRGSEASDRTQEP